MNRYILILFLYVSVGNASVIGQRSRVARSTIRRQAIRSTSCCCNIQLKITTCCTYYTYQPSYRVVLSKFSYYPCAASSNTVPCSTVQQPNTPFPTVAPTQPQTPFPSILTQPQTPFPTIFTTPPTQPITPFPSIYTVAPTQPQTQFPTLPAQTQLPSIYTVPPNPGTPPITPGPFPPGPVQPTIQPGVLPNPLPDLTDGMMGRPDCSYRSINGQYSLSWQYLPQTNQVRFSLNAQIGDQTNLWTGVGFGTSMADADMNLLVMSNGQVAFSDRTSTGYTSPTPDAQQDMTAGTSQVTSGTLTASWVRPLSSTDPNDKDLATCQTFQLPNTVGPVNNGQVGKHRETPKTQLICNIQNCVAANKFRSSASADEQIINRVSEVQTLPPNQCFFEQDGYKLTWKYDPISSNVTFNLTSDIRFNGYMWTGLGLGEEKSKLNDFILVTSVNGLVLLTDRHSSGYDELPKLDYTTEVTLLDHRLEGTKLQVQFTRPIATGDKDDLPLDDPNINGGCQYFMFPVAGGAADFSTIEKYQQKPEIRLVCHVGNCVERETKQQEEGIQSVWYTAKRSRST